MDTPKTKQRPNRVPVSGNKDILTVHGKDPKYEYRWVNDEDGRIEKFKLGGWEAVPKDDVTVATQTSDKTGIVGSTVTKYVGGGKTSILMRIPKEWYDEDQKSKQEAVDALERAMGQKEREAGYTGSIKITKGR